jgi:hypothetical protein
VQTSKRARALGTAVYKARPRSSSFLPTTTSFSQLVYQNLKIKWSMFMFVFSGLPKSILDDLMLGVLSLASKNRNPTIECLVWLFELLHIYVHPTKSKWAQRYGV